MLIRPLPTAVLLAAACSMGGGAFAESIDAAGRVLLDGNAVSGSLSDPLGSNQNPIFFVEIGPENFSGPPSTGRLTLGGGASADVSDTSVGGGSGALLGLLEVAGFGTTYRSSDVDAGFDGGRGVIQVRDGGSLLAGNTLQLGGGFGGEGVLEVDRFGIVNTNTATFRSGSATVSGGGRLTTGQGLLRVGDGGTFTLGVDGGGTVSAGGFTLGSPNGGAGSTVSVGSGGTLALGSGQVNAGSRLTLDGGRVSTDFLNLAGGTLAGSGRIDGELQTFDGAGQRSLIEVEAGDTLSVRRDGQSLDAIDNGGLVENSGTIDLGGSVFVNNQNGSYLGRGGTFRGAQFQNEGFDAAVDLLSGANAFDADFINSQDRRVTVTGGASVVFQQDLNNNGTLRIDPGSRATVVGTFSGSGTVTGDGFDAGELVVLGGVSIGNSPGLSTQDSADLVLGDQSVNVFEIEGTVRGTEYDAIDFLNGARLRLGGELRIEVASGFEPILGSEFELFRDPAVTNGGFATFSTNRSLADGRFFDLSTLATNGTITVVPEPGSAALLLAGAGLLLRRRRA